MLAVLPVSADNYDDALRNQLHLHVSRFDYKDVTTVDHGYLNLANKEQMYKAIDLMKKYLETIHKVNFLPFLRENPKHPVSNFWIEIITLNDPFRARYYFDIMAFQVIPKIAILYVTKKKFEQVIRFIDAMLKDTYLSTFLQSIPKAIRANYYEQVVYAALSLGKGNLIAFLKRVQTKRGFDINRLYYCADEEDQLRFQKIIASAPGAIQPSTPMDNVNCNHYNAQLLRVVDLSRSKIRVIIERL
ncbi:hypothetical protein H4R35_003559 [Dimargaris xerosporica]|nr:hypothetical protein H4R35_003559 [Dimargaris xerosporica]